MLTVRKKKKRKTRRRKPLDRRLFIFGGIGIVVVLVAVYLFLHFIGAESTAGSGLQQFRLEDKSIVVIRNESVITASDHSQVDFLVREGDAVSAGDSVARVYKLGYSDELMQSLLSAREAVYAAQMERIGSTKDEKLEKMNADIDAVKARAAEHLMASGEGDMQALLEELDGLLSTRMEYLRVKVQENENLRALYADAAEKEQLVSAWTENCTAPAGGTVSFYFDGYEEAFNAEKLNMVSANLIKRAVKETGASVWNSTDGKRVCRIVNGNKWVVAFVTSSSSLQRTAQGMEYEITADGYGTYRGVALEPVINGDSVVNLIEMQGDMQGLINIRTVRANITAAASGVAVKARAVSFEDGVPFIRVVTGKSRRDVRVDVLAVNGDTAIVRAHNSEDVLTEGVRYWYTVSIFKKK